MKPVTFWNRLNDLFIFNPARWSHREGVARGSALTVIVVFLLLRLMHFDRFPQTFRDAAHYYAQFRTAGGQALFSSLDISVIWGIKLAVWLVETAIFLGYIAAYLSRRKAVGVARGFMETAFPITVAGLPVLLGLMPENLHARLPFGSPWHLTAYLGIMAMMAAGGTINLIGLINLRSAFTIMTEARTLVRHGIFRYMRHPLYSGHFIMFLASLLLRWHWYSVILYLLFCIGQVIRARIEEAKMLQNFEAYGAYRRSTGMFFPKLRHPRFTSVDDQ